MKKEKEIRGRIKEITDNYQQVIDCYPATVDINSPRALMQLDATTKLDVLYWVLGEKRPKFKCDEWKKVNC